jgi:hypothetical protein
VRTSEDSITPGQKDRINAVLVRLVEIGIDTSAVISRDGTLLVAHTAPGEEDKIFASMYAAMLGAAEEAMSELRLGVPRRVVMEIGDKKMVATGAGPQALLVALVGEKANPPKAIVEIDKASTEVKSILASKR